MTIIAIRERTKMSKEQTKKINEFSLLFSSYQRMRQLQCNNQFSSTVLSVQVFNIGIFFGFRFRFRKSTSVFIGTYEWRVQQGIPCYRTLGPQFWRIELSLQHSWLGYSVGSAAAGAQHSAFFVTVMTVVMAQNQC